MVDQNLSTNNEVALRVREALAAVADASRQYESSERTLRTHEETFYVRPSTRTNREAAELYERAAIDDDEEEVTVRVFDYRPWDGAYAVAKTLQDLYGHSGFGVTQIDFFGGKHPPAKIAVKVGLHQTVEVPMGDLNVPWGEGASIEINIGAARDSEKGILSQIIVTHAKKFAASVKGLLIAIEKTLEQHSIYKGKAFTGAENPEFLDLSRVSDDHILFSHDVQEALERELWGSIERRELYQAAGRPTRWNCLFVGDYGTGKTLATILTAKRAAAAGITFIQARPGQDKLTDVMQMAKLYSPAIVAFEDVDRIGDSSRVDGNEISRLLEEFDGMRSKGSDVSVILTTNFPEKIDPGLLRAGRIQGYYEFGSLDSSALGRLVRGKIGEGRLVDLDEQAVFTACHGYSPAFMDLVIEVAKSFALSRHADILDGESGVHPMDAYLDYRIWTDDLVKAANRLRPQYDRQEAAKKVKELPVFDQVLRDLVRDALDRSSIRTTEYNDDTDTYDQELVAARD